MLLNTYFTSAFVKIFRGCETFRVLWYFKCARRAASRGQSTTRFAAGLCGENLFSKVPAHKYPKWRRAVDYMCGSFGLTSKWKWRNFEEEWCDKVNLQIFWFTKTFLKSGIFSKSFKIFWKKLYIRGNLILINLETWYFHEI